ncbi:DNA repair protein rhp41 [Colletotrichum orbiculare MAFF 240422]|uniref:DNA repair protein rhp41 n=1 Tax=Colletotrichum orbiculare (strain 104-T / ATCC 96160 / CBS 514.97 / LARS 414 / MAFF 240422) TaxID=1213857 RepID=A0A484G6P8_COLOR|nr:DNA repair protein rhp41 [Colletotrichum orbiculare MAFF 240422]
MLAEADLDTGPSTSSEPPLKKLKRPGGKKHPVDLPGAQESIIFGGEDDDEDVQFEDVIIPVPTVQTVYRDSDDEDDDEEDEENEEDIQFEDVDFGALQSVSDLDKESHFINQLTPGAHLPQFGQTESLKTGLQQAGAIFRAKFQITERGLRRALWAEDPKHLIDYELPSNADSCMDRSDFRKAAKKMQGSRDVGAQLYCGPALPKPKPRDATSSNTTTTARRKGEVPKRIRESPYPVYWVEVLDVAHQKWHPVDPLVTGSIWKPKSFEPPATDKENAMSYVIAFETDGTAKDVTRRYAKAYAAKTRRLRIETATERGDDWWRQALKLFGRRWPTDLDEIEDVELAAIEEREPMPRNVADFKDHPVFALKRHLRRSEVLVSEAQPAGSVAAGSKAPLEMVYRRKDVRVARSRDKWHRLGREVKPLEVPVKFLPRRPNARPGDFVDDGYGGDERDAAGTPMFTDDQTEPYRAPPVIDGRVPKNKFGNIEVFVASMVPEGGVHIGDEFDTAARASHMLGIDYAPALTGFQFKGKHGTAVLNGVVVAREFEDAVRAVMDGLGDMEAQAEQSKRALRAIKTWKRFLMGLRIRERIWAGVDSAERAEEGKQLVEEAEGKGSTEDDGVAAGGGFMVDSGNEDGDEPMRDDAQALLEEAASDITEEYEMEDDGGGGGFLLD